MTAQDHLLNLIETLDQLTDAAGHLKISYDRCKSLTTSNKESSLIEFEALTSRFARVVDILIHKVYRSIDAVEFLQAGTLIDALNRAEKRHLIDSIQEMRLLKDLRNDIAHEYISERLRLLHHEVFQHSPKLLELVEKAVGYCIKYRTTS